MLPRRQLRPRPRLPPVRFIELLRGIINYDDLKESEETYNMASMSRLELIESMYQLLELKKKGHEYDEAPVEESVVRYAERLRQEVDSYHGTRWDEVAVPYEKLDKLFMETVRRVTDGHFNAQKQVIPVPESSPNEGEFIFEYESVGDGWGNVRIGSRNNLVELGVSAMGRNPLRDMLFGLIEIRDYHREEYQVLWDSSFGDARLSMKTSSQGVSLSIVKFNHDTEPDDQYNWTLSLDELISATLKAAGKTLRKRGIVGFSKDWVKMNGDECDVFPFADFFALAGVKTWIEDGGQVVSTFGDELRILQGLQEEKQ